MGLAAFRASEEGDMLNHAYTSPAPSPKPTAPVTGGPPPAPEFDELSLVRTHFLLFKVDLDEPLISRLHGYDRKQRSEIFHSRLKTLFNRQYQSIYLYCIRIHVLHHCCHLHHHLTGTSCVCTNIYDGGGGGCQGGVAALARPTPTFNRTCGCGAAQGLPRASQPPAHKQRWLLPPGSASEPSSLPLSQEGRQGLGRSIGQPLPSAFSPSPGALEAGASPSVPCSARAPPRSPSRPGLAGSTCASRWCPREVPWEGAPSLLPPG